MNEFLRLALAHRLLIALFVLSGAVIGVVLSNGPSSASRVTAMAEAA